MPLDTTNDLIRVRLDKLAQLRAQGRDPFAHDRFDRSHTTAGAVAAFHEWEAHTTSGGESASEPDSAPRTCVAGRVFSIRNMGKALFVDLRDESGRIQLYVRVNHVGAEAFARLDLLDRGDFLGVEGPLFRTRTGEVTVEVREYHLLAKALRPLPMGNIVGEEQHGDVTDVEFRYRQRYADLAVHPGVREQFRRRSLILRGIRDFFDQRGYLEVETPVLQTVAGGAAAKPFHTYHNELEQDMHLRISLELYLKRLIVGGFEKVYEIGRVFRNEGVDTEHNPEFSLLESYEAYVNLGAIELLVEELLCFLATRLHGRPVVPFGDEEIDLTPPWPRLPLLEGIRQYTGVQPESFASLEEARGVAGRLGLNLDEAVSVGWIVDKIHGRYVQPKLIRPTFVTEFPLEISPLAKKIADRPHLTHRFELYVAGAELANAFSELNDPLDQRERFDAQGAMRDGGDEEAHPMDEDFLRALEYGMPPTGGLGIGIDRLVMLLTNQTSIRDVLLFPHMRPEGKLETDPASGGEGA